MTHAFGMKIIDCTRKGNVIRCLLADSESEDWWGDDWNDAPYEHNASLVYDQFVKKTIDIAIPFDQTVLEPADNWQYDGNSPWCRDDFKTRSIPLLIIGTDPDGWNEWSMLINREDTIRIYMGDPISKLTNLPGVITWE